jgi:hypothetical protein
MLQCLHASLSEWGSQTCLAGMEETNSEEIAVSDTAGAVGARGDEDVDLSAMSADELRSLILRERREQAASKPPTATTSIVTQSEPGPLTSRDQTGFFSPSETQAKTIPAITLIANQAPTSSTASKASLTMKPGVGGLDTALPGGVFRVGVLCLCRQQASRHAALRTQQMFCVGLDST